MSRLLIEIAASIRVLSDQVKKMPSDDLFKQRFDRRMDEISTLRYGLFDDLNLDLRDTCNKIIHSNVLEFHMVNGIEAHQQDFAFQQGISERGNNMETLSRHYQACWQKRKN